MSYDPGKVRAIIHVRDRIYKVESFRGEDVDYEVDLDQMTCTCKQYQKVLAGTSGKCKHIVEVEQRDPNFQLIQKARMLRDVDLEKCLQKYHAIYQALAIVHREREIASNRDANLKSLFS